MSMVEEQREAMKPKETALQIRQKEAVLVQIEAREELLKSRPSMGRGAKYHGAKFLHPITAQEEKQTATKGGSQNGTALVSVNAAGPTSASPSSAASPFRIIPPGTSATLPVSTRMSVFSARSPVQGLSYQQYPRVDGGVDSMKPPSDSTTPTPAPASSTPATSIEKCHNANTGFCSECDVYIRRALADQFGYKVAALVLKAATIPLSMQREVERELVIGTLEGVPNMARRIPMESRLGSNNLEKAKIHRLERDVDGAFTALAKQRSAAFAEHAAKAAKVNADMVPNEPLSRQVRYVAYGDKWIECFDEESWRKFYYNVTDGTRQWAKPPIQQWDLEEGAYTPMKPPSVFNVKTEAGETAAHKAEEQRLDKATSRALAAIKITNSRLAGQVPKSLQGADMGPPSARVVPGSFRVTQTSAGHSQ